MKSTTKIMFLTAAFALLMGLLPSVAAAQTRNFVVVNESSYRINHIYVTTPESRYWGSDRLGDRVLPPEYRFTLPVYAGWYDVKLIDEDGDSCIISNVDFRDGDSWTITNGLLVTCEMLSAR